VNIDVFGRGCVTFGIMSVVHAVSVHGAVQFSSCLHYFLTAIVQCGY